MKRILVCPFGNVNLLLELAHRLESGYTGKYELSLVSFTEYDRELYSHERWQHFHIPPGELERHLSEQELDEVTRFTCLLAERRFGDSLRSYLRRVANHYSRCIEGLIESHGFEEVVEFNGRMNLFIAALDVAADRCNLQKLVFEQGLFRPGYVTIDGKGVNARNSIDSLDALLAGSPPPYQRRELFEDFASLLPLPDGSPLDYKRRLPKWALARAWLRMRMQPRHRIFLRTAEGQDLLEAGLPWLRRRPSVTRRLNAFLDSGVHRYIILCPLQVETDTQVLLHSPWIRTMSQLTDVVKRAVDLYNSTHPTARAGVVFKMHPMDPQPLQIDDMDAVWINESTVPEILARRCDLVVTLNSTAAIEAIEAGTPVITLGDAFFNFPGIISGHCSSSEELPVAIEEALHRPPIDRPLQQRFIEALKSHYQLRLRA